MKKIFGKHYIIEFLHCNIDSISNVTLVEQEFLQAAIASKATILDSHFHQFQPHGVSGVILIAESHFTIHTWPENKYAAVDFFTCGNMLPEIAIEILKKAFQTDTIHIQILERGY